MKYKLHLTRTQAQARQFEKKALDDIWNHPEVGGFYPPEAKNNYRLQAMVLQDDGRPISESTVSVIFLLSSGDSQYLEIAIRPKPGADFTYGWYLHVPNGIAALKGRIEDVSMNGFHLISVEADNGRVYYAYNPETGHYGQLGFGEYATLDRRRSLRKAS